MLNLLKHGTAGAAAIVTTIAFVTLVGVGGASAQTTDPVMTEFDNLGDKVTLYVGGIVALVVLSLAAFLGIKYLRKGAAKA